MAKGMGTHQKIGEHPILWLTAFLAIADESRSGLMDIFDCKISDHDLHLPKSVAKIARCGKMSADFGGHDWANEQSPVHSGRVEGFDGTGCEGRL